MTTPANTPYVVAFTIGKVFAGLLNGAQVQVGSTGLTGPDPDATAMIDPTDGRSKVWCLDGTDSSVVNVTANPSTGAVTGGTVTSWAARVTALGAGSLPLKCALCQNFLGRMVTARQPNNAAAWFQSRKGNPLDWDYGASPLATSAIAGTDPKQGQVGQPIVALIAGRDDYLIYGCPSKLYWQVGDLGSGGQISTLSDQTGVISQRSWCFDENGVLYFMGNAGFYRLVKGGMPEAISGQRLKRQLDRINIATTRVIVRYDSFYRRVHIFLKPLSAAQGTCWVYDVPADNFFPAQYPQGQEPWAACSIVGGEDRDREWIGGGNDGYLRRPDPAATSDDGTPFESYVRFAPVRLGNGGIESEAMELHVTGVPGCGPVEWYWLTGASAEEVSRLPILNAQARGVLFAAGSGGPGTGFQPPINLRLRGGAHQLVLRQVDATKRWAVEQIVAYLEPAGPRR